MFSRRLFSGAEVTPLPISLGLSEPLLEKTLVEDKTFIDDADEEADTACTFVFELMFMIMTVTM
jgi:hypothetical protein